MYYFHRINIKPQQRRPTIKTIISINDFWCQRPYEMFSLHKTRTLDIYLHDLFVVRISKADYNVNRLFCHAMRQAACVVRAIL